MEEWWEFRLAIQLAPQNWGEVFPFLWWFRTLWFWTPLLIVIWTNDFLEKGESIRGILALPLFILMLTGIGFALSFLTTPHPPCRFLKIQELIPHGFYFCDGYGGLPEINSLILSGTLGYLLVFCSYPYRNWMIIICTFAVLLSGVSSILLVQAFVSDVLSGWVLGILLTFVSQKILSLLPNDIN